MRNLILTFVLALSVGIAGTAFAQASPSDFVLMETDHSVPAVAYVWLNLRHMHSIEACHISRIAPDDTPKAACVHMDDDEVGPGQRSFRSKKPFKQAVRDILSLPNPTTPAAVITAPDVATVGAPVTLSVTVVDPDYGDTWTYLWSESDATMRGGTFSAASASETSYTPAGGDGTVVVQVRVTDDAGQSSVASHPISVTGP